MPPLIANREQALGFLLSRIDYERTATAKDATRCFKLDRMQQLLHRLGDPQLQIPAVHIAGTKGKGSTAAMTACMLSAAGHRVGLFTSPHILDFEERMRVDGVQPDEFELVELTKQVAGAVTVMDRLAGEMRPTYFEIVTAIAWLFFTCKRVDLVVLEVGLGGRLDATNLCASVVTVITNISYDHTAILGTSLAAIAAEKAGIIKRTVPLISGVETPEARAVVRGVCESREVSIVELGRDVTVTNRKVLQTDSAEDPAGQPVPRGQMFDVETPWRSWPEVRLPLIGEHQAKNAAIALAAIDLLDEQGYRVANNAARSGLADVLWPLRVEVLGERPTVVVDAAHNVASARALMRTLDAEFPSEKSLLVFAATRDKDFGGMLEELHSRFETILLTTYVNNPRGVPVERVQSVLRERCGRTALVAANPETAWKMAASLALPADLICITGSFFLAAEMREIVSENPISPVVASETSALEVRISPEITS